jgi:hypothetical protein
VLDTPLVLVDDALVDRTGRLEGGEWKFVSGAVRLGSGIGFGVNLDQYGALLVGVFDGTGPLRAHLKPLAAELGAPEGEFTAFAERLAHHLVEHGFARPA